MKTYSFINNNKGIAPVIGEILLIAVVVILASVIASYISGMGGNLNRTYLIGTTADQIDSDTIDITYFGGKDSDYVLYLNVSVNGSFYDDNSNHWYTDEQNTFDGDGTTPIQTGTMVSLYDNTSTHITTKNDHVLIIANFVDGTKQVVLNIYV